MSQIPYGRQSIDEDDIRAVVEAVRSDWLTIGPRVAEFEQLLASIVGGVPCVSVTSGTSALHTAYAAAGLGPGDEVVTTPLTFAATATTVLLVGATVIFADVEEDTGNLDAGAARAACTSRTRAVTAVDYAGHPADLDELLEVARGAEALLIEDAAHSIGSTYRDRPVGSIADLTTFSFFPTKNVTTGEGGAIATPHPDLERRARRFRNHGLVRERGEMRYPDEGPWHQEIHALGLNYRLPDVLAALGTSQLRRLDRFKTRRAEIVARYDRAFGDCQGLRVPPTRDWAHPMRHLYPVRVPAAERRRIFEQLHARGVLVQVNYIPVYWHPVFEDLGYRRGMCPVAERFYAEEISLPLFPSLSEAEQDRVIDAVLDVVR